MMQHIKKKTLYFFAAVVYRLKMYRAAANYVTADSANVTSIITDGIDPKSGNDLLIGSDSGNNIVSYGKFKAANVNFNYIQPYSGTDVNLGTTGNSVKISDTLKVDTIAEKTSTNGISLSHNTTLASGKKLITPRVDTDAIYEKTSDAGVSVMNDLHVDAAAGVYTDYLAASTDAIVVPSNILLNEVYAYSESITMKNPVVIDANATISASHKLKLDTIEETTASHAIVSNSNLQITSAKYLKTDNIISTTADATIQIASPIALTSIVENGGGAGLHLTGEVTLNTLNSGTASKVLVVDSDNKICYNTTVPVANGGTGQSSYTDGQLLIGNSSGNTLTKATLTAGTGITVTNGNGSITIAASSTTPTYSLVDNFQNGAYGFNGGITGTTVTNQNLTCTNPYTFSTFSSYGITPTIGTAINFSISQTNSTDNYINLFRSETLATSGAVDWTVVATGTNGAAATNIFYGMSGTTGAALQNDMLGFYSAAGSTVWSCISRVGGTPTTTASSVASNNNSSYRTFRITINSDFTSASFYIDGALIAIHSAVPTTALKPFMFYIFKNSNANYSANIKSLKITQA